ncbi:MAG: response regulator [Desulfuromonadales bacterium]
MQQFKSISIRNDILTLIFILTFVPFGFMVYSLVMERNQLTKEAFHKTALHAEQTSRLISQMTGSTELLLNMLSRLPIVQAGNAKAVNSFLLDLVSQYPEYSSIFIVDESGRRWATTNSITGSVSYKDRKYFANAMSSGRFSSGEYAIGKIKKKPVFSFGLPVRSSSEAITGVVVATIELSGLKKLLQKQIAQDNLSIMTMDHGGKILLNSTNPEFEGTQQDDAVFKQILQGVEESIIEIGEKQGSPRKILAYKKLYLPGENSPYMYAMVEADKQLLLKDLNRKFGINLTILLASVLLSLVISYRFSKRFLLDKVDESEQCHRVLFETSPQGIIYRNANGAIISANPVAERFFGKSPVVIDSVTYTEKYPEYIHEDGSPYPAETHPGLEALSSGKTAYNKIMGVLHSPDENYIWLKINSIPICRKGETRPYMVYSMLEDVTRQKEQERERLELERQILHAQKLESLGVMAGGIAHDFNNLLQSILGNIELAARDLAPVSGPQKHIANALISGRQATHLTSLLLAYIGRGFIDKKELNLNLLVRENADMFRSAATTAVSFELSLSEELPAIIADEAQIQQVVMNLISNASEAIEKQPGFVTVTTGVQNCDQTYLSASLLEEKPEPGNYVFLEVSDNGCGISKDIISRLFDPFFTIKFTGRGLGMSAVMGIMKAHSGALFVETEVGKGTTFRALFPVYDFEQPAKAHILTRPCIEKSISPEYQLSGLVLVVDDEKSVLRTCSKMVQLCGFTVVTACDGIEAVTLFRERADEIDAVLMDMTMPNMDGIAAMNEIHKIRPDAKVILASGFNEEELGKRATDQAPSGFIRKPYSMSQLEIELQRVLVKT